VLLTSQVYFIFDNDYGKGKHSRKWKRKRNQNQRLCCPGKAQNKSNVSFRSNQNNVSKYDLEKPKRGLETIK